MIEINPNKTCYIFDVDGTLTEPRKKMNLMFANEFNRWSIGKQCFIATGSDYKKTLEQVPINIIARFELLYCCMANEILDKKGNVISKSSFVIPDELDMDLRKILEDSSYQTKTGNHLEFRTGMLNFSIVGRNANTLQRNQYNLWDKTYQEREKIAEFINTKYPTLNATVGGSISIDIIEEGCDKGQVIHHLENLGATKIVFVGDKCYPGGNDYGIVRELEKTDLISKWYNVKGPDDTLRLLRTNRVFDGGK